MTRRGRGTRGSKGALAQRLVALLACTVSSNSAASSTVSISRMASSSSGMSLSSRERVRRSIFPSIKSGHPYFFDCVLMAYKFSHRYGIQPKYHSGSDTKLLACPSLRRARRCSNVSPAVARGAQKRLAAIDAQRDGQLLARQNHRHGRRQVQTLLISGEGETRLPTWPPLLLGDRLAPGLYLIAHTVVDPDGGGIHGLDKGRGFERSE